LRAEAAQEIDAIAAELGTQIVGNVRWGIQDGQLVGEARVCELHRPAGTAPYGWVVDHTPLIRGLAKRGNPDRVIADILGATLSAVAKARANAKPPIPPGRGNPTLAGYQPQQLGEVAA
jgi:hypothetical protein